MKQKTEKIDTDRQLTKSLSENTDIFKTIFQDDNTVVFRKIRNAHSGTFNSCLIYIDGMIDVDILNKSIIYPVMNADLNTRENDCNMLDKLENEVVYTNQINKAGNIEELLLSMLYGNTILLVDGFSEALVISSKGWQTRALAEPDTEKAIRGSREGFTESIMINLN